MNKTKTKLDIKKMQTTFDKLLESCVVLGDVSGSYKHPKCFSVQCNHPLDPVEYDCGYMTTIACEDCKYSGLGGRKDPEAKCNQ